MALFPTPSGSGWNGLVPVSYWLAPERYPVRFRWTAGERTLMEQTLWLTVVDKDFPVQHLRVSTALASQRSEERLAADTRRARAARANPFPRPLWTGRFGWPLEAVRSSEFGVIRLINGQVVGRHSGLDLAAPTGTPLLAPQAGRVALACTLHVTGETVFLDHGLGLFTTYAHLSSIDVREGERVRQGQVIGRVGSTGFATGPHLHWGARVGDAPVDPEALIEGPLAEALLALAAPDLSGLRPDRGPELR